RWLTRYAFAPRGFAPRTPLHRRSRGPIAPLRSGGSLATLASSLVLSCLEAARSLLLPPMAHSLRFRSERLSPLGLPSPVPRGAPLPRSAPVPRSPRSLLPPCYLPWRRRAPPSCRRWLTRYAFAPRGFAPRTPLHRRSRGPIAPLRSGGSLATLASSLVL